MESLNEFLPVLLSETNTHILDLGILEFTIEGTGVSA